MRIVQIAAEMGPIAKVGGLADVVQGLPHALSKMGHELEIILPKYSFITEKKLPSLKLESTFSSFANGQMQTNIVYKANYENITLYLIEPDRKIDYFLRPKIYGYVDDVFRFTYFSSAAMAYLHERKQKIDILHLHDWHTSLCAFLYKNLYSHVNPFVQLGCVLTISNLAYQGKYDQTPYQAIGINPEKIDLSPLIEKNSFPPNYNLLQGGINLSNAVVAVSPTYAKEIFEADNSCGLLDTLKNHQSKIQGLLNGLDYDYWNPSTDPYIHQKYSCKDPIKEICEAKKQNKKALFSHLGMDFNERKPLISCITRLVPQKGPLLIKEAITYSLNNNASFILLGSSPDPSIQKEFEELKKSYQTNRNVSFIFSFQEELSHWIYASADFIVVPSLFEPCGLTQLISLRYGTIPIVRKVGGLSDTIFDVDDQKIPENKKNGFTFQAFSKIALTKSIKRALFTYEREEEKIHNLIFTGMHQDFSWKNAADAYVDLYKSLVKKPKKL